MVITWREKLFVIMMLGICILAGGYRVLELLRFYERL